MDKVLERNIGWGNNEFSDRMFEEKNNQWFIIKDADDIEKEILNKLFEDSRIIVNKKWDSYFVNIQNVDDVEKEYNIESRSIIDYLDVCYGDWEQDYDIIGENIGIGDHEAYELVGNHIEEILEELALRINNMTSEQLREISYDDLTFIRDGLFFKITLEEQEKNLMRLKEKYRDFYK